MRVSGPLALTGLILALGVARPSAGSVADPGFPARLAGEVTDAAGLPLNGVSVRVFVGGLPVASARTDSAGTYAVEFKVDPGRDDSVVACAIAPRPDLVSEWAILRQAGYDRDVDLWGPCVPRVGLSRSAHWTVQILDATGVRERLAGKGCLGESSAGAVGHGH
jgi:hypothetical protein